MKAYLLKTVKRLKKEASWRSSELKKMCVDLTTTLSEDPLAREAANTDDIDINAQDSTPISFDIVDPYFYVIKAALESRQSKLMDIGFDALHYFIQHDYLKGKEIINVETQHTLMDDVIETVCRCEDEYDEVIQLQKMKVLLTAVTSISCGIHGASLLLSLRSCFHIHLISKNQANKTTAKAALTQTLDIINQRMEVQSMRVGPIVLSAEIKEIAEYSSDINSLSSNPTSTTITPSESMADVIATPPIMSITESIVASINEKLPPAASENVAEEVISFPGGPSSPLSLDEEKSQSTTHEEEAKMSVEGEVGGHKVSDESVASSASVTPNSTTAGAAPEDALKSAAISNWSSLEPSVTFDSPFHRDAFLVLRALCRLSSKGLHDESETSIASDSIALKNKILSLELILHILKHCGPHFCADEKIIFVIRNYLCVSLLSNCTSHEVQVVSLSLQVFIALMESFKEYLKSELEIFITNIFLRILESENSSNDHKIRVLEVFMNICKDHILLVEIFVNYDCDFEAIDLFKRIVDGFAKIAKSQLRTSADSPALRVMGLEGLVVVLKSLLHSSYFGIEGNEEAEPPKSGPKTPDNKRMSRKTVGFSNSQDDLDVLAATAAGGVDGTDDPSVLPLPPHQATPGSDAVEKFDRKKKIQEEIELGILKFNLSPKKGIAYLVAQGHLEMDPKSVALFFRQYQDRLDKTVVGEYLGREREYEQGFCIKVLNEYVDSMEFTNMKFDEAIRFFLAGFRLPGEAQKIDRLMEKFAERYFLQNRNEFASADMAFILAFSTIMLQTNLHNPAIKDDKRMTKEQFIKQNKGITPDGELSDELLSEIYDRISQHPISLNKDDVKVRKAKSEEATLRNLLSSGESKRKELFSDERREMVKAGEALFKQKVKSKLGNTFVHTSKKSDEEYVRPMFEVCWAPMIGVFSQILETSDYPRQVEACIRGLMFGTRLAGRLEFSIVRQTYMNALSKFTTLESTREVNFKNIECIKGLIKVATTEGDYLQESWIDVLKCVSQLDRLSLIFHDMRSEETNSVSTTSSSGQNRKSVQRTSEKDPLTKLFLGLTKAESMRITDEANAELLESAVDTEDIDRIFLNSQNLSGEAVYIFVQALCSVSLHEISTHHPRVFTLQKLVEVADFNMGSRPRLDWDRIWSLLATHFTTVGLHRNLQLAMYAVDSLKQLSIKFLQKVELANFNFQRKFLKPFEIILSKTQSFQIKDLVIRCLDIMIQACAVNIRSGWRSIFAIFEVAAGSEKYEVSALAFEVTERLIKTQFDLLIFDFVELMNCLVAFVTGPHSLLSLSAISHVSTCADHLARGDIAAALESQHNYNDPMNISWEKSAHRVEQPTIGEDTSVFRLWWPLLLGLSTRASDSRAEIRIQALETLHRILSVYGHLFSAQTWNVIFKGVLFPMIDSVLTDNTLQITSLYPSHKPAGTDVNRFNSSMGFQVLSVCLSLFHQHRFKGENDTYILLPELLTLLEDCVCQDSESLATIGTHALQDFIKGFQTSSPLDGTSCMDASSANLICARLNNCMTRNLVFDFSEAGVVKLKPTDLLFTASDGVDLTPSRDKSRRTSVSKREVAVRTPYGDGVFVSIMPADPSRGIPQRNKIQLAHGAFLYTTDELSGLVLSPERPPDDDDHEIMFAPELTYDQAWIQLAGAAMTSMVVTLDLIAAVGDVVDTYLPIWDATNISTFLTALHSCHSHAHAFNKNSALRINLKLAGFMKFPENSAMLPHLLDQEIDSLMQILGISMKLFQSKDQAIKQLVSIWFCKASTVTCARYTALDSESILSSDKFVHDQLLSYSAPVLYILASIEGLNKARFVENISWIIPLLSSLIVCNDRRVREATARVYEVHVNSFILNYSR